MKTAEQWQVDLAGETSVQSIREIQADAVAHALWQLNKHRWSFTLAREALIHDLENLVHDAA